MAARWKRDLFTNVIPFWEKHSLDREHGGYFTCLDRDGAILDDSKYMWLQARAVFTWSRLFNELPGAKKYFDAAQLGADFLKHGKDAEGRLYFAVSRDGTPFNACKGGNYKGFFHVPRALLYALRSAERQGVGVEL